MIRKPGFGDKSRKADRENGKARALTAETQRAQRKLPDASFTWWCGWELVTKAFPVYGSSGGGSD
jgi:hypothetical protein